MELGAIVGALIGMGTGEEDMIDAGALAGAEAGQDGHLIDAEDVWYVADMIPDGATVAIGLIEHRWAIGLRDAIGRAWVRARRRVDPSEGPDRGRLQGRGGCHGLSACVGAGVPAGAHDHDGEDR